MGTTVLEQTLNDTQMFVLQTFATARNEQEKEDLTSLYLDYIQRKKNAVITQQEEPDMIFEPDDDFYRSISAAEFRGRLVEVVEKIDKKYAKICR